MANEEHLAILKQGVEAWNQWRKENPDMRPDLRGANLSGALLSGADLNEATLSEAILLMADLSEANLSGANVEGAIVQWSVFGDVDLSVVKGLDMVEHRGPSTVGIDTIYKSKGKIPEVFLRGCGVPDNFIAYVGSLVGKPIEYYSCFIVTTQPARLGLPNPSQMQ
jgi:hypothetical protein